MLEYADEKDANLDKAFRKIDNPFTQLVTAENTYPAEIQDSDDS